MYNVFKGYFLFDVQSDYVQYEDKVASAMALKKEMVSQKYRQKRSDCENSRISSDDTENQWARKVKNSLTPQVRAHSS